jgi:hypothetical protein
MKKKLKLFIKFRLKNLYLNLKNIGIDLNTLFSLVYYPRYLKDKRLWLSKNGKIDKHCMILSDYKSLAGNAKGHYFHQDLLVSSFIFKAKPKRHIDIGSRIDGFVLAVASYREIEVIDIRDLKKSEHKNIKFRKENFINSNLKEQTDSVSCLHAIEHFGLGRYGDTIDCDGHIKGINNLVKILQVGGILYISFPIGGRDQVFFNAHRIFHPKSILKIKSIATNMKLIRFDWVDDSGYLHKKTNIKNVPNNLIYGCGIYTFKKKQNIKF